MNGNKKIIHFLSASDRINYGDLLFPIIFKKFAEKNNYKIDFNNYGIIKSDLSKFGALPTMPYNKLLKQSKIKGGKVVIGGGEVFFANWSKLYSFISPTYAKLLQKKWFKKLNLKFNIAKRLLISNKVDVPFAPSLFELQNKNINIYYSSVGGNFVGNYESNSNLRLKKTLEEASLLSVRDKRTQESMNLMGLNVKLVPDSALIMSDIFNKESLIDKVSIKHLPQQKYIFVQIGRYKGPKDIESFSRDLMSLSSRLNLEVVLCPIGKAPGHEDDKILKIIKENYTEFNFIDPQNIFDVMFLIANSSLYMGTSLHGVITAQSFEVPFIGLNPNLVKVDSYIKTWISKEMDCLSFEDINKAEKLFNSWDFQKLKTFTANQKAEVYENLKFILDD
jgi:hypothetical protein